MVNSLKRLNWMQIVGLLIQIVGYIICCFNESDYFINFFWCGVGLTALGTYYFTDKWTREGKTWYNKMDKKRDNNFTRKPSDFIFWVTIALIFVLILTYISELWFKGITKDNSTLCAVLVVSLVYTAVIIAVVERTNDEVEMILDTVESKKRKKRK